jgi:hypothetical protein
MHPFQMLNAHKTGIHSSVYILKKIDKYSTPEGPNRGLGFMPKTCLPTTRQAKG